MTSSRAEGPFGHDSDARTTDVRGSVRSGPQDWPNSVVPPLASLPASLSQTLQRTSSPICARRVLVVDDNPTIHQDFRKILTFDSSSRDLEQAELALFGEAEPGTDPGFAFAPFEVASAHQGEAALSMTRRSLELGSPYAVAFVDLRMPPGMDGVETARQLWMIDPRVQIVLCTAYSDYTWEHMASELGSRGSFLILKKPFDAIEVRQIAHALSDKWRLFRENEATLQSLERQVKQRTRELEHAIAQLRVEMSDRLRLEKELRHAQKLEALGRLAAGIGHEINNPLAYVLTNLEHTRGEIEKARSQRPEANLSSASEAVDEAISGADRIRRIIKTAKEFSRPTEEPPSSVDVAEVFDSAARIVGNELRHRAQLKADFSDTPRVRADPHRLEQVFVNVLMNATQALSDRHAENLIHASAQRVSDECVRITIRDTGAGIPDTDLERVFDPFFSTRPTGQGTGLGLWICRSIVESFGGRMQLESHLGRGTSALIELAVSQAPPAAPVRPTPSLAPCALGRQAARVLLVDDEPPVLRGLMRALSGHDVTMCSNARDAVELYRSQPFDIVFCDLMMPDFTGRDFLVELEKIGAEHASRVVMMTGGVFTDEMSAFVRRLKNPCVAKPFDTQKLRRLIEKRLSQRGESLLPDLR